MRTKQPPAEQPKKVAIYCRVSTYEQGKGDYSSLKSQEDLLRGACKTKGWIVHDVYIDTKSGTNLERDELKRLLEMQGDTSLML